MCSGITYIIFLTKRCLIFLLMHSSYIFEKKTVSIYCFISARSSQSLLGTQGWTLVESQKRVKIKKKKLVALGKLAQNEFGGEMAYFFFGSRDCNVISFPGNRGESRCSDYTRTLKTAFRTFCTTRFIVIINNSTAIVCLEKITNTWTYLSRHRAVARGRHPRKGGGVENRLCA